MLAILALVEGVNIYTKFDRWGWRQDSTPDTNAKIISINSEQVQYVKNGAKFKTTIEFSDGFYFITHKTNRSEGFFTYKISIDDELRLEIIQKAITTHNTAILKDKKFKKHFTPNIKLILGSASIFLFLFVLLLLSRKIASN